MNGAVLKKYKRFIVLSVAIVIIIVLCIVLVNLIKKKNSLLVIENVDEYYYGLPEDVYEEMFASLNKAVSYNTDNVPTDGALIRDSQPFTYEYTQDYSGYTGQFIVDIPDIEQSYSVSFDFTKDIESGKERTAAAVTCVPEEARIYPDFGCKDYNDLFEAGDWR